MNLQLSPAAWLSVDTHTRIKIAELFGISQRRSTHVSGGQVVDSGHDWVDMEIITKESIAEKLGIPVDEMGVMWEHLVKFVTTGELPVPVTVKKPKTKKNVKA